jgi:uncharacterized protein (TIGR03663 family)
VFSAVVAVGALLRTVQLDLKPLHHDEGVNGMFLLTLFREGIYRYDPANYHGPTLYYFGLIASSINSLLFGGEGLSIGAIRSVPVCFGIGLILLTLAFRNRMGPTGSLIAAGLIAFSPGMVYFSRDFIHEMLLVFFTLSLVVCGVRYWDTAHPRYVVLGAIAAALMVSTKETAPISMFAIVAGAVVAGFCTGFDPKLVAARFGDSRKIALLSLLALALFALCSLLFFSSFFGNYPQGIHDAIASYSYWARTGMAQYATPPLTYVRWLIAEEPFVLLLGGLGMAVAVVRRDRFAIFVGGWALGLLLVYSLLPYKTPWLVVNMILPMCLAAGYGVQELWSWSTSHMGGLARSIFAALVTFLLAVLFYQSWQLNFRHYDDPRYVYAYVQTDRDFLGLIAAVNEIARNADGRDTSMAIVSREYWPLPWYLRDYRKAVFYGKLTPTKATLVIGSNRQQRILQITLGGDYRLVGTYRLRPGVELVLFATQPRDLQEEMGEEVSPRPMHLQRTVLTN